MTNADRIRRMTDVELAYFLVTTSCSICCDHPLNCGFDCASLYTIKSEKIEQEEKSMDEYGTGNRLIDADAFSEQYGNYYAEQGQAEGFIGTVGELIAKQPTVEAKPVRHGRWIEDRTDVICSSCGCRYNGELFCMSHEDGAFSHCPKCGAELDGGDDNG